MHFDRRPFKSYYQLNFCERPLLVGGFVITFPFAAAFTEMRRIYNEAELRKTVATDL